MKIIYPIEGGGGGAVTHVLVLAKELKKRKIPVLVAFLTCGPSVDVARDEGIDFVSVPKRFLLDLSPLWGLMRLVRQEKITIIHTHTIRGNYYGRLAACLCNRLVICVTTVHSHIVDELRGGTRFGLREWLLAMRERLTWRFVRHYICVSQKIKERLLSNGIADHKISAIENAVELPELSVRDVDGSAVRREFHIAGEEIVVGVVGRLVPLKNHELFLRSAQQLSKKVSNIRFLVVGDGPLLGSLVTRSEQLGIDRYMNFTGWRNDVQRLLCAFDIYVICSLVEGLNVSVLEAMACAKPVVGTNVKGVSEIVVHEKTGLLVPSNDTGALTAAVLRLVEDEEERKTMGLNGRQLVEKEYPMCKMIDSTVQVYNKLQANSLDGGK